MHVFVFGGAKVTTKEERLDTLEKRRVGRHHIFELPVLRTILSHHDLAVVFNYLCLDLAWMLVHQGLERDRAADHGIANFFYAGWTKTVSLAWETEWRRSAFVGFEQWTRRPVGPDGLTFRESLVDGLKSLPGDVGETGYETGAFYSRQLGFIRFPPAKLVTKQGLYRLPNYSKPQTAVHHKQDLQDPQDAIILKTL